MREIIFRGKRASDGKWIEGSLCTTLPSDAECYIISYFDEDIYYTEEDVIPETVGQYTGLNDSTKWEQLTEEEQTDWLKNHTVDEWNGKKIFEGDIFKFPDEIFESYYTSCGTEYNSWEVENYGVVGFCEDTGRFDFVEYKFNENSVEADLHENHDIEFYEFVSDLEIIGNIHDNPELLKKG